MFMLRKTHRAIVARMRESTTALMLEQELEIATLTAELGVRQVIAIRDADSGRFTKRRA